MMPHVRHYSHIERIDCAGFHAFTDIESKRRSQRVDRGFGRMLLNKTNV